MADERLTDRTTLSELADGDLIHVVDISDTTDNPLGTSKKGLWSLFKSTLLTYFNTQYLRSVTGDSVNNTDPLNPVVNAIPLSGTTSGNPVSGDVLFGAGVKAKFQRIGGSNTFSIYNNFGQIRLEDDTTGFYLNLINSSFSFRNQNFISTLSNLSLTANRSYNLPDKNGTFAMLDDIPAAVETVTGDSVDNTDPANPVVNAIPLSGTTVGNPVTGDIELNNNVKIILNDVSGDIGFIQGRNDGEIEIGQDAYGVLISADTGLIVDHGVRTNNITNSNVSGGMSLLDTNGVGLTGVSYYGANYTDNTYVQKKYVDDKVSGTTNYISKFTASDSIGNSQIYDNGTNLGVGNTSPSYKLDVSGTGRFTNTLTVQGTGDSSFAGNVTF
jgi:hypothetical protein